MGELHTLRIAGGAGGVGQGQHIGFRDSPPRRLEVDAPVFGYVELAEGPWLETQLVDVAAELLTDDMPVRVTFLSSGEMFPAFRSARPARRRSRAGGPRMRDLAAGTGG